MVGEALAFNNHALTLVLEPGSQAQRHKNPHQCEVKHQVGGLPQIAALTRATIGLLGNPIPRTRENGGGTLLKVRSIALELFALKVIEPVQVFGGGRWWLPKRLQVVTGARQNAPDQGDEKQQIYGREPDRGEGVEKLKGIKYREEFRIVALELDDTIRVTGALRHKGAGNSGQRQEQQQHQRGPHAGELAPNESSPPAQP